LTLAEAHLPGQDSPHQVLTQMSANTLFEPWQHRPPPFDNPLDPKCIRGGAQLHGPLEREAGIKEFVRIKGLMESIEKHGYDPNAFPLGLITGILLKHEGRKRFLVIHGQHRTAILTAMGHEEILVGSRREGPATIDSSDAENWPHVKSGLISKEAAVLQFSRHFSCDQEDGPAFRVRDLVRKHDESSRNSEVDKIQS
ncbi:MAG: hypothetical protein AAF483_31335, partial [Planctomycetota bacterium]